MKKISVLLLTFCLVFLCACGKDSPSAALKADLEDAKSDSEAIMNDIGQAGFGEEATDELINKMLEFEYKLGEEKVGEKKATVETTITTYPFGDILKNAVDSFTKEAFENPGSMNEKEASELLGKLITEELNSAKKSYTKTVTVTLSREDEQWVVNESREFTNALTGGLLDFSNTLVE